MLSALQHMYAGNNKFIFSDPELLNIARDNNVCIIITNHT
jgi:hypothetical protein